MQARLFNSRTSLLWLFLGPVFHMSYLIVIFSSIRVRHIGGVSLSLWLLTGLITYFLFSWTSQRVSLGVSSNKSIFAFRQILPIDTLLVRSLIEAILLFIIFIIMYLIIDFLIDLERPSNFFFILSSFFCSWMLGIGWGLMLCLVHELLPDFYSFLDLIKMPLYFISGVIFPISLLPAALHEFLLYNPLAHSVEFARSGLSSNYHMMQGVNIGYGWFISIFFLLVGLIGVRKYSNRLIAL